MRMTLMDGSLFGTSTGWLFTASVLLCVFFAGAALRYRTRLSQSLRDQKFNVDLIANLCEGIYRSTPDGHQISANLALVKLNGYETEAEMLSSVHDIGSEWYVQPQRRAEFQEKLRRDGFVADFVSEIYRHKTRERIWVTESARLVYNEVSGRPLFYEGSVREITETVKRLKLEEQFQKLTREFPGGLFQFRIHQDGTFSIPYISEGVARITGYPFDQHLADPVIFDACVLPEDRAAYYKSLKDCNLTLGVWEHEFRIKTFAGEEKWVRIVARPEKLDGDVVWYGHVQDISSRKTQEMEISDLAYFDPLTRLPNRRLFMNRMVEATAACALNGDFGALLFIDLDNFKTLNDTQGHDVGDDFLVEVAARLRRCIGPRDLVARIGGDEFVIILEQSGEDASRATLRGITVANRALAELREDFELGSLRHGASASIGVVVFGGSERRADEILKRADIAMYQAKASGRNRVALFDPVSMDRQSERYRLLSDLRVAFERDEIQLHFQPLIDDTGTICGAEALIRWNHPVLGTVMPDQFIGIAEQFGLGSKLVSFVFDRGLTTLRDWQVDPRTAGLRLALNISVQSFASEDFIPMVRRLLELHPVDASKLTLELTEHVMAKDHEVIAGRMREAKTLGMRLSLDDFGTGYSSLAYLKQLPFDEVKIDGGFVRDIETTESDRALVKTILAMARTLGLMAVAEHVENVRQEAFLRAFGCDFFQGYLYSRAIPADDFLDLVYGHKPPSMDVIPMALRHQA